MIYEIEYLVPGTKLVGSIALENYTEIEEACFYAMLKLWESNPHIGGKIGQGFGKVNIEYKIFKNGQEVETEKANPALYYQYIEENKAKIKEFLRSID